MKEINPIIITSRNLTGTRKEVNLFNGSFFKGEIIFLDGTIGIEPSFKRHYIRKIRKNDI